VVGVHVGLDLEDEAGHLRLGRHHHAAARPAGRAAAGRHRSASASSRSRTPKLLDRRAEEHRRQMAGSRKALRSKAGRLPRTSSISSRHASASWAAEQPCDRGSVEVR
jgi:hypothetical protein